MSRRYTTTVEQDGDDNIYVNIVMLGGYNDTNTDFAQAIYEEFFQYPLIKDPSQYYFTVVRSLIPINTVPPIIVNIKPGLTQFDPNLTPYKVTCSYSNTHFSENVYYLSSLVTTLPVPPSPGDNNGYQVVSPYYYLYSYFDYLPSFNNAIRLAYQAMFSVFSVPLGALGLTLNDYPFLVYYPESSLFALVYNDLLINSGVELSVNDQMAVIFSGIRIKTLDFNSSSGRDVQWIFYNDTTNAYPYLSGYSQSKQYAVYTPSYITPLNTIQFISTNPKINHEYLPSNITTTASGSSSSINFESIVFDLQPLFDSATSALGKVKYDSQNYRLVDISSKEPLQRIKFFISWTLYDGRSFPMTIPPGSSASIKLGFLKKSLFKK